MPDLLLELFSEEIPARMQTSACANLKNLFVNRLGKERLSFSSVQTFVTPRRLCIVINDLPKKQPDIELKRKGPKADAPKSALDGFLKSTGVTIEDCTLQETPKGKVWFCSKTEIGSDTKSVFQDLIPIILQDLPWPKSMRWGSGKQRWVRPLHSILCVFDEEVVPFNFAGVSSGNSTQGHRFMGSDNFQINNFSDYREKLFSEKVILNPLDRETLIRDGAQKLVNDLNLTLDMDDVLLNENVGLNEWPVPLIGSFDPLFLSVPEEVLVSAMRSHQKYFAIRDSDGNLAPKFILISNLETADGGKAIISGNERVLRARLSDARFFWEVDLKTKLEIFNEDLQKVIFQAKLGSVGDKIERITSISKTLCDFIPNSNIKNAERAAHLCKADLVTEMVGEFPDLQGIMGSHYARAQGESDQVASAIAEHYRPQGPSDQCPSSETSVVVALADKIDTLVGFFLIDEKPTGSKDPYALRRAALGIIRLILENQLSIPLGMIISNSISEYEKKITNQISLEALTSTLLEFFTERLKVHLREKGIRHDLISAVFAAGFEDDLLRLLSRVDALKAFLDSDDGANLLIAYRRAANILRIEETKDKKSFSSKTNPQEFTEQAEKNLMNKINSISEQIGRSLQNDDFRGAMVSMSKLRAPVDDFFEQVKVNDSNLSLRENRLRLLFNVKIAMDEFADFSLVQG
tara:strand:+ start:2002 stop:4077 length:2076 start_codon:yes stop_codon:yes gene_type:complete